MRNFSAHESATKTILIIVVIAIIIISSVGGYWVLSESKASTSSTSPPNTQYVASLAYAHWQAIGEKNLSAVISQYSAGYEALWWYVNGTSFGLSNGRYDCNYPTGPNNCSDGLRTPWREFFNNTPPLSYIVCNFSLNAEADGRDTVRATVWYYLQGWNETLKVPYEMDLQNYNGTWAVWRDWFGLQQEPANVIHGYVASPCGTSVTG